MAPPSAERPDATKANSTGAVVLLDLENVIGSNPPPEVVDKCLSAVLELAATVAVCWAAYPQRLLSEQAREVVKRHGVKTQWAKAGNNSADRALLKLARKEADKGRRRFIIVSGDADFAPLADLGTLEVIARYEQKVGSRLRRRASRIHRLPEPDSAARRAPASAVRSADPPAEQRPEDAQRLPIPRTPVRSQSRAWPCGRPGRASAPAWQPARGSPAACCAPDPLRWQRSGCRAVQWRGCCRWSPLSPAR